MTTLNIVLIIGCIVVITFSLALIIHTFILTKLNKHAIDDFSLEINDISNEFYDEFNTWFFDSGLTDDQKIDYLWPEGTDPIQVDIQSRR